MPRSWRRPASAIPLVLAVAHLIDVFDGRNVIAAWVPFAVLIAVGLGCARAGRAGVALGAALCAIGLGVIVATNLLPGYQRDDWRGAAQALPAPLQPRVIVVERFGGSPLSVYLGPLREVRARTLVAREIAFPVLRTRHTYGAPSAPYAPLQAPHGFRLAAARKNEAFAVTRFVAVHPTAVSARELLQAERQPEQRTARVSLGRPAPAAACSYGRRRMRLRARGRQPSPAGASLTGRAVPAPRW